MVIGNTLIQRLDPKEQDRREREAEQQRSAAGAKFSRSIGESTLSKPAVLPEGTHDLASLGPDVTLGNGATGKQVELRWHWTPQVQADPSKVWSAIALLKLSASYGKLHIVNEDAAADPSPAGVYVDGKLVQPAAADGSIPVDGLAAKVK